jgi:hypothetical protein
VRLVSSACTGNRARFSATASGLQGGTELMPPDGSTCVDTGNDAFVHYQLRISSTQVEVFTLPPGASDLASAVVLSGNVSVSRGYVHLVHSRVSSGGGGAEVEAAPPASRELRWGSVSFDGPMLNAGRNYDVADSLAAATGQTIPAGYIHIGHRLLPAEPTTLTIDGVDLLGASAATLSFDLYGPFSDTPPQVRFNGRSYRYVSDNTGSSTWRTISMNIPLTDLVAGRNTIDFLAGASSMIVANVSLHLDVGGAG